MKTGYRKNKKENKTRFFGGGGGFEVIHNSISRDHKFVDLLKKAFQVIKILIMIGTGEKFHEKKFKL